MSIRKLSLLAAAFLTACALTPTEIYEDMKQAMEAEVEPLVETTLPTELTKDADKIDFVAIRSAAMRVRTIFRMAQNADRKVYIRKPAKRKHAAAAARWFTSLADAATHEQKDTLVALFKQKDSICAKCHER